MPSMTKLAISLSLLLGVPIYLIYIVKEGLEFQIAGGILLLSLTSLLLFSGPSPIKPILSQKELLENNGIHFTIDHKLVRGLDYYTDTAFEFQTNEDKRQNAILAGGRYDKLISLISSRDIPGIGWAAGVERLMSLINIENQKEKKSKVLFAVQNEKYLLKSEILK